MRNKNCRNGVNLEKLDLDHAAFLEDMMDLRAKVRREHRAISRDPVRRLVYELCKPAPDNDPAATAGSGF